MSQFKTHFEIFFADNLSKENIGQLKNSIENSQQEIVQLSKYFFDNLGAIPTSKFSLSTNEIFSHEKTTTKSKKIKLKVTDYVITSEGKMGWIYDQLLMENIVQNDEFYVNIMNRDFILSDEVDKEIMVIRKRKQVNPFSSHDKLLISGFELLIVELLSKDIQSIYLNKSLSKEEKIERIEKITFNIPENNYQVKILKQAYSSAQQQKNFLSMYQNWLMDKNKMYLELTEVLFDKNKNG
jgi:hypothetical protein